MTYEILIGDRSYSSWSLRGWLLFEAFDIPVRTTLGLLYDDDVYEKLRDWAPARTVPAVRTPHGGVWTDSIAIAEGLAEAHGDAGIWPEDSVSRALARSMVAEMHSGFGALRGACPMNLRLMWQGFAVSDAIKADLDRVMHLWSLARARATDGPWLFGHYGAADAFYAPVAMRIAGYDLPVSAEARAYVEAHLAHGPLRRWRAMGEANDRTLDVYDQGLPTSRFPIPKTLTGEAVDAGPAENESCPYSGKPVTDFARIGGRVFGFCNAFCRDKTVADPEAWPAFMNVYHS